MPYSARIILDSISPAGHRLTTMILQYPRFIHSELMTHRVFSCNSSSSRAIPIEKMIEQVTNDPVMPVWWGKNQSGMQAREELSGRQLEDSQQEWLSARNTAVNHVKNLMHFGLHKQISNRLLEPWMWITVIVSATEWENFFALRCHKDAQPEMQKIAYMARGLYRSSDPQLMTIGSWHMPFYAGFDDGADAFSMQDHIKMSVGRCARVSYLTHDGRRDPVEDIKLHDQLMKSGHMSPFEHVATPDDDPANWANFKGWRQYRREIVGEAVFQGGE